MIREPSWEVRLSLYWICSLFCISIITLGPHHRFSGEIWRNRNQLINFEYDVLLAYFVAIDLAVARLNHFLDNLRQCPQSVIFGTLSIIDTHLKCPSVLHGLFVCLFFLFCLLSEFLAFSIALIVGRCERCLWVGIISWLHRRSSLSCRGALGVCRGGIYLLGLSDSGRPILTQGWIFFNES